jgi:hypothetical protein
MRKWVWTFALFVIIGQSGFPADDGANDFIPNSNAVDAPVRFRNQGNPGLELWDFEFKEPLWFPFCISINDLKDLYGRAPDRIIDYNSKNGDVMYLFTLEEGFILYTIRNNDTLAMIYPQNTSRYGLPHLPRLPLQEDYLINTFGGPTGGENSDRYRHEYFNDKRFPGLRFDIKKDIDAATGFRLFGPAYAGNQGCLHLAHISHVFSAASGVAVP